jgi:hypothetical protein
MVLPGGESFGKLGPVSMAAMAQPGKQLVNGLNDQHGTITILTSAGCTSASGRYRSQCGAYALIFLAASSPRGPPLGRLGRWLSMTLRWLGSRPAARALAQRKGDLLKQAVVSPIMK